MFKLRLITEGKTDRTLLESLLDHKTRGIDIPRLAPKDDPDAGGYEWLVKVGNLDAFLATDSERFGIIVDADLNASDKWRSLRDRLISYGFDESQLPASIGADGLAMTFQAKRPLGVWIMPDNLSQGNVEDFFTKLIKPGDQLLDQAKKCVGGLPGQLLPDTGRSKAVYRTWLAWQKGGDGMSPQTAFHANRYDAAKAEAFLAWIDRLLRTPAE